MDLVKAVVYGLVQGLTEFLPVSSTAHIRIVPSLLGWQDPGAAFTAIIQLGTVAAVLIYFAKDLGAAFMAWLGSLTGKKSNAQEVRMGWAVFVGTIPIVVLGLVFKDKIETSLRSLNIVAGSLILMGIVMLIADSLSKGQRNQKDVQVKDGLFVGLWQCLSLIPGMSRSGSTISGALFQCFDRVAAARFSFLLSVPSVAAAGLYEGYKGIKEGGIDWGPTAVATVISFVVGYAAIAYFIKWLGKHGLAPFVWYRIALGVFILVLVQRGVLNSDQGAKSSPKTNPQLQSRREAPVEAGDHGPSGFVVLRRLKTGGYRPSG